MRIVFLFLFKKKGWGGSRERITYLNLKVVVFVFRGKDHEDSQADDDYYYYHLSDFGKRSLCTAASKKEIFFIEIDHSVLELMTKLISLTEFKVSLSLFIVIEYLALILQSK